MKNRLVVIWKVFRTFLAGTVITLAIAASVTFKADEGSAAALITLCCVTIFFLGLLSRLKKDFPSFATIMSLVLAIPAALFWLLDERAIDATRADTLLIVVGASSVFGMTVAGVHISALRNRAVKERTEIPRNNIGNHTWDIDAGSGYCAPLATPRRSLEIPRLR